MLATRRLPKPHLLPAPRLPSRSLLRIRADPRFPVVKVRILTRAEGAPQARAALLQSTNASPNTEEVTAAQKAPGQDSRLHRSRRWFRCPLTLASSCGGA